MKQKKHQIFSGAALAIFLLFFGLPARGGLYDFYVDAGSAETEENGSKQYPFKSITAALNHIQSGKLKNQNVFVKKGIYAEEVELVNNTNLIGENRHETIVNGEGKKRGIYFHSTKSRVRNITVEKAGVNLKIDRKSRATVENCSIKKSNSNGVEVERSISKKYEFIFKNSSVKDSGERGMYIFKRKFEIVESDISGNQGEGIDLHTGARGIIKNNEIGNNGESGIEMIMAGAKISIRANNISRNKTQGITIQVYNSQRGSVRLTKNNVANNNGHGIRYARYDRNTLNVKFRDFIEKCVKRKNNSIGGNGKEDYGWQ